MTVTNPIHPLYDQSVVVRQIRKVGKQTKVIVESPMGGFLSLDVEETNLFLQQTCERPLEITRLFLPEKLLRLSEWVVARSQSFTEKSSCALQDKEVERKKKNDTTASTKVRSNRKLRKDATLNQTDSTPSRQNASEQQWLSTGYPDKE